VRGSRQERLFVTGPPSSHSAGAFPLRVPPATILPLQPRGFFSRARRFSYALGRRWWRLCQAQVGRIQVLTGASYAFKTPVIKRSGDFRPA
jgi:hypothetical protein